MESLLGDLLLISVMAFLIVVGNSLTIATLLGKKFRKRSQFLLISLAFADLLVGCATKLYVIVQCRFFALSFVFNVLDMFAGLSSIFHLAVISLERLHATVRPLRHRQLSLKAYWVAIATPWVLSSSVSTLMKTRFRGMLHGVPLIIAHNMFFLPGNLEKDKNKYRKCEKLSTKSRSKIFKEHFPCNGSIFLDMDTFSVFTNHRLGYRVSPHSSIYFFLSLFILFIYLLHFTGQDLQLPRGKGHKRTSTSHTKVPHLTHPPFAYERQPQHRDHPTLFE